MQVGDIGRYLLGGRSAIERIARSRAAFPTGALLVLLTSIPRNYDQTHITESPVLWVLTPLLFSLISGTWLYVCAFGWLGRMTAADASGSRRRAFWRTWPGFMGLFWLTAPIAWIYAIPVERFLEPEGAARANVGLLGFVALWRVALMARVYNVLCVPRAALAFAWIWTLVAAEALGVLLLPYLNAEILAGMAGLRRAPAEEVIFNAISVALATALVTIPIALIASIGLSRGQHAMRLPVRSPDRLPWALLATASAAWLALALWVQPQVARSAHVEQLMKYGSYRQALDYIAAHEPGDFAPSRPLPPSAFGWSAFHEVPGLLAAVQESDPSWVRRHLLRRLETMVSHFSGSQVYKLGYLERDDYEKLVSGLQAFPEGRDWAKSHESFLADFAEEVSKMPEVDG